MVLLFARPQGFTILRVEGVQIFSQHGGPVGPFDFDGFPCQGADCQQFGVHRPLKECHAAKDESRLGFVDERGGGGMGGKL